MNTNIKLLSFAIISSLTFATPIYANGVNSSSDHNNDYNTNYVENYNQNMSANENSNSQDMSNYDNTQATNQNMPSNNTQSMFEQALMQNSCLSQLKDNLEIDQAKIDEIIAGVGRYSQMDRASAMSRSGQFSESQSCFISAMSNGSQQVANHYTFNAENRINLSSSILANREDMGKNANLIAVVSYTSDSGETSTFMRDKEAWANWDGRIESLTSAQQVQLEEHQKLQIFDGNLGDFIGKYSVSVGYMLEDGSIVYNPEAMQFDVQ